MVRTIKFTSVILVIFGFYSCRSYKTPNQAQEQISATIEDENLRIELVYVGKTPNYHIVECALLNKDNESHGLDRLNFELINKRKNLQLKALDPNDAQQLLSSEKTKVKKEKKNRLVENILVTGLSAVVNAGAGVSVAENIFLTAESAVYIADDHRFYNRNIKSIEDEKKYVAEMVLDYVLVPSKELVIKDLLFPIEDMKGAVEIIYRTQELDYIFEFSASAYNRR